MIQTLLHSALSLEGLAVILALAYLLLAARENILCWYCAFASSALYTVILWDVLILKCPGRSMHRRTVKTTCR